MKLLATALVALILTGCVTTRPPIEDYTLAREAIDAAKAADAAKHALGFLSQAEEAYTRGKKLYDDREYTAASTAFSQARSLAEKAENSARWLRYKSGEVL